MEWPAERSIDAIEIKKAFGAVSGTDPAGILPEITLEDVLKVAAHMNPVIQAITRWNPWWNRIVEGNPAARDLLP